MCAFIIIMHSQSFSDQCPSVQVDNRSYVLASHERLPVHMDLPTAETGVSSVRRSGVKPIPGFVPLQNICSPIRLQLFKRNANYGYDHVSSMCAQYSRSIRAAVSTYVYLHHT